MPPGRGPCPAASSNEVQCYHDITFDTTSPLGVPADPGATANERTPSLDLDSVYGGGPVTTPRLYNRRDRAKLRIGFGGQFEDLPRGTAATRSFRTHATTKT